MKSPFIRIFVIVVIVVIGGIAINYFSKEKLTEANQEKQEKINSLTGGIGKEIMPFKPM